MLNTPDLEKIFGSKSLPLDDRGLLYPLEMIAFPGTKFQIHKKIAPYTLEVTTEDYPNRVVYIDSRFVIPSSLLAPERPKILPHPKTILTRLENALGLPYVWGGNWSQGIAEILSLYQPPIQSELHSQWALQGLDCSGLLYEATSGVTPRNTSELMTFGKEITSIDDIQPLDILIYPGHVVIAIDKTTTIESRYGQGVILTPLADRIAELSKTKFLVKRFIP